MQFHQRLSSADNSFFHGVSC
uniref:Uncharacterized protein n=1 Tax=Anguilla anguilla TaxID=7936 RepID=A0A0E9PX58_ANGAN